MHTPPRMCCCMRLDCSAVRLQFPGGVWCNNAASQICLRWSTYVDDELPFIKVEVPMCLPHAACIHTHAAA